jgi:predicted amidohydrolase
MMKIYCCQLDIAWENKVENFKRIRALLNKRRLSPGSLLLLPEMFATGFSMNARAIAEQENGPTDGFLRELARDKGVFVLGGLARSASRGRILNEAVCFAPSGRRVAHYAKLHLFSPGGESRHYAPGAAVTLFHWGKLKVAVSICYDLRFPEIFRMAVQRGANLLVVIANWPGRRHLHWTALLRARAIENQAYAIGVNRCGKDPQHNYDGGSLVVDPWGKAVAEAGRGETLLPARLDLTAMKRVRLDFPVLRDIRTRLVLKTAGSKRREHTRI